MRIRHILLLLIPFWLLFFFINPPLENPDEDGHYAYVQSMSHGVYPLLPASRAEIWPKQSPELQHMVLQFALSDTAFRQNVLAHEALGKQQEPLSDLPQASIQANHPPLYFFVAAIPVKIARMFHAAPLEKFYLARAVSGLFYFVFLYFALRTYRLFFSKGMSLSLLLATALQPMILMLATSVNPEMAVVTFSTIAFYYMIRMFQAQDITKKSVAIIAVISAMAVLSKLTGVVTIPIFLSGLWFFTGISTKEKLHLTLEYLLIGLILLVPWLAFNHSHYQTFLPNNFTSIYNAPLVVKNSIIASIAFTVADFRAAFTMLPGEMGWLDAQVFTELRTLYIWLLELVGIFGLIVWLQTKKTERLAQSFAIWCLFWMGMVLTYMSLSFHHDYSFMPVLQGRYGLPVWVPLMILVGYGISLIPHFTDTQKSKIIAVATIWYYIVALFITLVPRYYV